MDPFDIYRSSIKAAAAWMAAPQEWIQRCQAICSDVQRLLIEESTRYLGTRNGDRRLPDTPEDLLRGWLTQSARGSRKLHHRVSDWLLKLARQAPDLTAAERRRVLFWTRQLTSALQPSNCFWLNTLAVSRGIETKGRSIHQGLEAFIDDLRLRDGLSRLVNTDAFEIGRDLAATPGSVVYRNRLMELIQYAPTTPVVYDKPVVVVQPWINKYYIFDLQASNSLVRFLVDRGFSVFITSWKNPTPKMRAVGFEDYMLEGALAAIHVARRICGGERVHAVGYCIGGTALAALMAWLHAGDDGSAAHPVADWTLFATLVDFSEPGDLGVFISPGSIAFIHTLMEREGVLNARYIGLAFRLLKADHLIWRAFTQTCLQGQPPPDSDLLYWNSDATHLSRATAAFLLKALYLENRLVERRLELAGRLLDLKRIDEPLYLVGALQDHICPWPGTFATCHRVKSPVRYVLANEGHIAGVVNPPSTRSRKKFWAGTVSAAIDPIKWLASQSVRQGSWWNDWADWLPERGDVKVPPPSMGCAAHPIIAPAPGKYVGEM